MDVINITPLITSILKNTSCRPSLTVAIIIVLLLIGWVSGMMPTGGMFLLTFLVFATLEPVGIKVGGAGVGQHPPGNRSSPFAIPLEAIS